MKGKIYEPTQELAEFVMCYWTLDFPKEETPMETIRSSIFTQRIVLLRKRKLKKQAGKFSGPKCQ